MHRTMIDELNYVYEMFCDNEGLPHDDARDLIHKENLLTHQKEWLEQFIAAWDAVEQIVCNK